MKGQRPQGSRDAMTLSEERSKATERRQKRWIDRWELSERASIRLYVADLLLLFEDHCCMGACCEVCRLESEIRKEYRLGKGWGK